MPATPGPTAVAARGIAKRAARWDPVRGLLLLLVLLASVAGLLLGARPSSYAELRGQVAAGEVDSVQVDGTGVPPGATGFTTIRVEWRDGVLRRTAEVVAARPLAEGDSADGDLLVIRGDVTSDLRALDPDVVVVPVGTLSPGATLTGWEVPEWVFWAYLVLLFLGLAVLRADPEPWRASRWGWFWPMLALPPFGLVAFLLLAAPGPTAAPRPGARRLTGGWSFLLTFVVLVPLLT